MNGQIFCFYPRIHLVDKNRNFGRALQGDALQAWKGNNKNKKRAQDILLDQAKRCYAASMGWTLIAQEEQDGLGK